MVVSDGRSGGGRAGGRRRRAGGQPAYLPYYHITAAMTESTSEQKEEWLKRQGKEQPEPWQLGDENTHVNHVATLYLSRVLRSGADQYSLVVRVEELRTIVHRKTPRVDLVASRCSDDVDLMTHSG